MEVNELRIGNWYIGNDEKKTQWKLEDFSLLTDLDGERPLRIDEIVKSPIPLTEEWLLKFGFEKNITIDLYPTFNKGVINVNDGIVYIVNFGFVNHIKYVHQLQNLYFAITNTELNLIKD